MPDWQSTDRGDRASVSGWSIVLFVPALFAIFWTIAWLWPPATILTASIEYIAAALLALALVLASHGRAAFRILAFRPVGWRFVLAGTAGALLVSFLLGLLELDPPLVMELVEVIRQPGQLPESLLVIAGLAPVAEELIFRGFFHAWLDRRWGPKAAVIVSSIVFGLVHQEPELIATALPTGLFLGWLRWRSNSIVPSIIAHIVNNTSFVLFARYYAF